MDGRLGVLRSGGLGIVQVDVDHLVIGEPSGNMDVNLSHDQYFLLSDHSRITWTIHALSRERRGCQDGLRSLTSRALCRPELDRIVGLPFRLNG
jgi:hypothetical protein